MKCLGVKFSMKLSRMEAFSDGVFAVAITLLVFNLKVPDVSAGHLGNSLGSQWPSYVAYVISFLSIGVCWVNHHSILDRVAVVDRNLLFINLGLLLGIVSYLTATAFSLVYPVVAFSICLILAVYYVFGVALEVREKE